MKRVIVLAQFAAGVSGSPESGRILAQVLVDHGWHVVTVFAEDGPYVGRFQEIGSEVHVIRQHGWLVRCRLWRRFVNFCINLHATVELMKVVHRTGADVVYVNSMAGLPPAVAGFLCRVPVCWHIREQFAEDGGEMQPPRLLGRWGVQRIVKWLADRVITVSAAVMDQTIGGCSPRQGRVVQNGLPDVFFRPPPPAASRADLVIGVPGTLRPMKGQDFLLKSAAAVLKDYPRVQIAMTGRADASYQSCLDSVIERYQLGGHVQFVGETEEMPLFLAECDIAVVPSRADPLPRTVMESMASGLPLVATRVGGIPEMVDDGVNGVIVDYGDEPAMAESLRRLIADPHLRHRLGTSAHNKARCQFTEQRYRDEIMTVIDEVCAKQPTVRTGKSSATV